MVTILGLDTPFPPVEKYLPEGIVAVGGDLSPQRLISAYTQGIFPWFNDDEPVIWWSPDPRMVLFPEELKVSKSMAKLLKKQAFTITYNQAFREVITQCSQVPRDDQDGTWITSDMINSYCELNQLGYAMSVEVWQDEKLVGGLYGIDLGNSLAHQESDSSASNNSKSKAFCGESMFSLVSNASKYAFISLVQKLQAENYQLIDCQLHTEHLESLGAREVSREEFLSYL